MKKKVFLEKNTKEALADIEFNPKLKDLDIANCLLAAINLLLQGPFFKSQNDFNRIINRRAKNLST